MSGEPAAAMTILGLDTSTAVSSTCVRRADGESFETPADPARLLGPPVHATELLPAVHGQLDAAGIGFGDLDCIAVGVGPGAYTGLRIGVATARAIAQARDLEVRAVGSLEALAAGIGAPVSLALIDARRGELFAALHARGEQRLPPFVATPEALVERVTEARSQGVDPPLAAGDGSLRFRGALEAASIEVAPAESHRHVVSALHVCRLAEQAPALPPEAVMPRYLRAPDAKPR